MPCDYEEIKEYIATQEQQDTSSNSILQLNRQEKNEDCQSRNDNKLYNTPYVLARKEIGQQEENPVEREDKQHTPFGNPAFFSSTPQIIIRKICCRKYVHEQHVSLNK